MNLYRAVLPTLAVAVTAAAVAAPAASAAPAQITADARICAALTVDGIDLLRGAPSVSRLLAVTPLPAAGPSPDQIAAARQRLGCGAAPGARDDAAVAADVCAALDVALLRETVADVDLTAQVRAIVSGADPVLPTVLDNARSDLQCGDLGGDPDADVTPTPAPSTGAAPTADPADDSTGDDSGGSGLPDIVVTAPPAGAPTGAPETGA